MTVHNGGGKPVTDLPISVGYQPGSGPQVYLNSAANLLYFQAHLPAIAARHSLTWVYTTAKRLPSESSHSRRLGASQSAPALLTETERQDRCDLWPRRRSSAVTVHLDNTSSVPQYQLQVYAYGSRAGRYVVAGNATVPELDGGSKQVVRLKLVGAAPSANLHVAAIPTILQ